MVSNLQLLEMCYRINTLMGVLQTENFGKTVHVLFVGDLFQLKPVIGDLIFKDLSETAKDNLKKRIGEKEKDYKDFSENLWKDNIQCYELTEIMRQKDDKPWAEALKLFREGNHTAVEEAMVEERIYKESQPYPFTTSHLYYRNAEVNGFNKTVFDKTEDVSKTQVKANTIVIADVSKHVKDKILVILETSDYYKNHKNTGGFVDVLELCVGLKYDFTMNIDTEDGITNGTSCTLKLIEYKEGFEKPSVLWVEFDEKEVGVKCRSENRHLYSSKVESIWTPTVAHKTTFEVNKHSVMRQQFPIVGSAARTIHCCQGKSLQSAVMSLPDAKIHGIHYVGLSRVTKIENLTILDFNKDKITVSDDVKEEMQRLRTQCKLTLSYTPVYNMDVLCTKVLFHNVTSLHYHIDDLRCDRNYLFADVIGIAESRLTRCDLDETYSIKGFQRIIRNDQISTKGKRPPHGIAIYLKESMVIVEEPYHYQTDEIEFSLITVENPFVPHKTMQLAFLYKGQKCNADLLLLTLKLLKSKTSRLYPLAVLGDFNIDPSNRPNLVKKIEDLLESEQQQREFTYIPNEDDKSMIDLVFSQEKTTKTGVIESLFSNHRLVTFQC